VRAADVHVELYDRLPPLVRAAVEGLSPDQLTAAPAPGANTIAWLVWHLTRVHDHHLSEVMETDQLWTTGGFASRFGRDPDPWDVGFGHGPDDVAALVPDGPGPLVDYHDAVHARTRPYLQGLTDADLDRVVDRSWDPPVTLGVRLVSVADDALQHVGQALYVRGVVATFHGPGDPRA
jgi:uncharacterized damage-inducible protein DinB